MSHDNKIAEVAARLDAEDTGTASPEEEASTPAEAEASPAVSEETTGDVPAPSPTAEEKKPVAAPVESAKKTPEEDRAASKFAALQREKNRNLEIEARVSAKEKEVAAREAAVNARAAELEGAFANPEKIFETLQKTHGVSSLEDLQKYAQKAWTKPVAPKEEERPLTRKELDAILAQEAQKQVQSAGRQQGINDFLKLTSDDEKYEATAVLLSKQERIAMGDRFFDELRKLGEPFTLEDVADMVEESARKDERYALYQKKRGTPAPTKALTATGQQGKSAQTAPKTSTTPATGLNGQPRLSHAERMARAARG